VEMFMRSYIRFGVCLLALANPLHPASWPEDSGANVAALEERSALWKSRLDLGAWNVSVRVVRRRDLDEGTVGRIWWSRKYNTAVIYVLHRADYDSRWDSQKIEADQEVAVVHEMVHLRLANLRISDNKQGLEEASVVAITRALMKADAESGQNPSEVAPSLPPAPRNSAARSVPPPQAQNATHNLRN